MQNYNPRNREAIQIERLLTLIEKWPSGNGSVSVENSISLISLLKEKNDEQEQGTFKPANRYYGKS